MRLKPISLLALFVFFLALSPQLSAAPLKPKNDARIWLNTKINGKPTRLAFDTGACSCILFKHSAKRLGISFSEPRKTELLGNGRVIGGVTQELELELEGNKFKGRFGVVDIPNSLQSEVDLDGVVGWGSLSKNILKIDAQKREVSFLEHLPQETKYWTKFQLVPNSDIVLLDTPSGIIFVDTGDPGGVKLGSGLWRKFKAKQSPTTLEGSYGPSTGFKVHEVAWAVNLPIGDLKIAGVAIIKRQKLDFNRSRMTLGMQALKDLDLILDGIGGVAYLRAKNIPPQAYPHNRLGAIFVLRELIQRGSNNAELVAHVVKGSPAWEAGIRNGDLLKAVGKKDLSQPTIAALRKVGDPWHRPPGTKYHLTLKRKNEVFKTEVTLRQILQLESKP